MHEKGICHRDIKPQNILVSNDLSMVKIIDFNVSKCFRDEFGVRKMRTHTGTIEYSAPELLAGEEYTYTFNGTWIVEKRSTCGELELLCILSWLDTSPSMKHSTNMN